MNEEFCLDDRNEILKNQYEKGMNYRICEIGKSNICYIFCSSNGIYYPNTAEMFIRTIIEKDRYEWEGVAGEDEIKGTAGKIIFIRDIYKQYYINGINGQINTIDKLCEFLNKETTGMRTIICGTSSGGYIATILGIYLNAAMVFNFGGAWSLEEALRVAREDNKIESSYYFLWKKREDEMYKKYYDITKILKNSKVPIMYFYSALNKNDNIQRMFLDQVNLGSIRCFAMKSSAHGYVLFHNCYKKVITSSLDEMVYVSKKCRNKVISLRKICFYFLNKREAVKECLNDIVHCHKSLQWICKMFAKNVI